MITHINDLTLKQNLTKITSSSSTSINELKPMIREKRKTTGKFRGLVNISNDDIEESNEIKSIQTEHVI